MSLNLKKQELALQTNTSIWYDAEIDKYYLLDNKNQNGILVHKDGSQYKKFLKNFSGMSNYKKRMEMSTQKPEHRPYIPPYLEKENNFNQSPKQKQDIKQNHKRKSKSCSTHEDFKGSCSYEQTSLYNPSQNKLDGYTQFSQPLVPQYYNILKSNNIKLKQAKQSTIMENQKLDGSILLSEKNQIYFSQQKESDKSCIERVSCLQPKKEQKNEQLLQEILSKQRNEKEQQKQYEKYMAPSYYNSAKFTQRAKNKKPLDQNIPLSLLLKSQFMHKQNKQLNGSRLSLNKSIYTSQNQLLNQPDQNGDLSISKIRSTSVQKPIASQNSIYDDSSPVKLQKRHIRNYSVKYNSLQGDQNQKLNNYQQIHQKKYMLKNLVGKHNQLEQNETIYPGLNQKNINEKVKEYMEDNEIVFAKKANNFNLNSTLLSATKTTNYSNGNMETFNSFYNFGNTNFQFQSCASILSGDEYQQNSYKNCQKTNYGEFINSQFIAQHRRTNSQEPKVIQSQSVVSKRDLDQKLNNETQLRMSYPKPTIELPKRIITKGRFNKDQKKSK